MFVRSVAVLFVLVSLGCSRGRPGLTDGGTGGGTDTGPVLPGTDSGPRPDTGTTTGDPCLAGTGADALRTLGCNGGFASGTPAPNAPAGTCAGDDASPVGSCSSAGICSAGTGMSGWCFPSCTPGTMYVSRGGCPTGFRCFDLTDFDLCFRDCDASHPCPAGMMCDAEGSCAPPPAP